MQTLRTSLLARALLACVALVMALFRYHWFRWTPALPASLRDSARWVLTVRMANAWSMYVGRLCVTVPMPWSRVFLDGTAISCPWMLPKKSGIRTALGLSVLLLLLPALSAHAQEPRVLPHGAAVKVAWDASVTDPALGGADAPAGYRFETFRETETGVVLTTVDVPATATTAELPSTVLPTTGKFLLAVKAFNEAGESARSNALPFVRPSAPSVPTGLRVAP